MNHLYRLGINVSRLANSDDLDEMIHFIRVYIVCYKYLKKGYTEKEIYFNLEIKSCDPSIYIMDHLKINASYRKEESLKCIHG